MRDTDWEGNWVLFWWVLPCLVNLNPVFCWWVELCSLPAIYLGPNYGGGNEDNGDLLLKIPCMYCCTQCPDPASGHRWPRLHQRLLDTHGQVWVSLLWGHCSFIPGPGAHEILFVPSRVSFPGPVEVLAALGGQASQVNVYISWDASENASKFTLLKPNT